MSTTLTWQQVHRQNNYYNSASDPARILREMYGSFPVILESNQETLTRLHTLTIAQPQVSLWQELYNDLSECDQIVIEVEV